MTIIYYIVWLNLWKKKNSLPLPEMEKYSPVVPTAGGNERWSVCRTYHYLQHVLECTVQHILHTAHSGALPQKYQHFHLM